MRKILMLMLVVALLVTAGALTAQAAETGYCEKCSRAVPEAEWTAWSCTEGSPAEGHFYLAENFITQTETVTIPYGRDVCIDLRGHTWVTEDLRTFVVSGNLSIMDSVGGGKILTTGANNVAGGFAVVEANGMLSIYGGTIQRVLREDIIINAGGLVYVNGGTLEIHGGTLAGGMIQPYQKGTTTYNGQGGNIYLTASGTLNMYGGTVTGGMARRNSEVPGAVPQGGNIYALSNAIVNIAGGTVTDGYCDQNGGNIYIAGATLNFSGGTVKNGYAMVSGGNICHQSSNVNAVTISGGYITGGVAAGSVTAYADSTFKQGSGGGGNYYGDSAKGSLTITGGTIDGDMKLNKMESFTLSGAPKIGLGKSNGLRLASAVTADISGLTEGTEIFVNANHVFTKALADEATATAMKAYFKEAVRMTISVSGTALKGSNTGTTGYCPHCYDPENPQKVTWASGWSTINTVTADNTHRYLTAYAAANRTIGAAVIVDLNGHTLAREGQLVTTIAEGKSLTVLDSCGGGKIAATGSLSASSTVAGGVISVSKDATFTLLSGTVCRMDPWLTSNAGKTPAGCYIGGVIYGAGTATVNIQGGVVRDGVVNKYHATFGGACGGNIGMNSVNGKVNISGGIIRGGTAADTVSGETTYSGKGGNIYCPNSVTVTGGIILDGNAGRGGNIRAEKKYTQSAGIVAFGEGKEGGNINALRELRITGGAVVNGEASGKGGNIYFGDYTATRTVVDGTIIGGTASSGGNIYMYNTADGGSGVLNVTGGAILSGVAAEYGGNIGTNYSTLNVEGGSIAGGNATLGGGIFLSSKATLNLTGGEIVCGEASDRGGNIYSGATNNAIYITGGVVADGTSVGTGGNIQLGNGTFTMTGGILTGGTGSSGGNLCATLNASGSVTVKDDGNEGTPLPQIIKGTATTGNGGNLAFLNTEGDDANGKHNTMTLGNVVITGGKAAQNGDDLYINKKGYTKILSEFSQRVVVYIHTDLLPEGTPDVNYLTCEGVFAGQLVLENDERLPLIYADESDNTLKIAVTVLIQKDGTSRGYGDNASAMAAYDENTAYIRPTGGSLVLAGKDYTVDVGGQALEISGTGTVTCFDSSNHTFAAFGTVTLDGPTLVNTQQYTRDGKLYITLAENGSYSFHYLQMQITEVALRPGTAGVYYKSIWNCDDMLYAQLKNVGVAVSLAHTPDSNFMTDEQTLYTASNGAALVRGQAQTSAMIDNIFAAEGENNSQRGKMHIYAVPYVVLQDDTCVVGANAMGYSMYDVLKLMDDMSFYYDHKIAIENFYTTWAAAMADWDFENIGVKPADDTTLRILMVGNSFCYYYVEELYALLMENPPEGIEAVEVYNLYYSGCTLAKHLDWWQKGEAHYDLFMVDAEGRKQLGNKQGWTLEAAMAQGNWDYLSIQGASGTYLTDNPDATVESTITKLRPLLTRFHTQFPDTQLLYHRTWASEIGRVSGDITYTEELLEQYDRNMQYICEKVCEEYADMGLTMVNSGTAWKNARQMDAQREEKLIPYGGLCARLGYSKYGDLRAHSGDGYHDGDIGGAQLLNAYMWYMTITGDRDLSDSTYAPVYTYAGVKYPLSAEFIDLLKNAAEAVFEN